MQRQKIRREMHGQKTFGKEIFAFLKYCNNIHHKTFFIVFDLILLEIFLAEKTTLTLEMLTLLFRMGHENFTHRFNFESYAFFCQINKDSELKFVLLHSTVACNKFNLTLIF